MSVALTKEEGQQPLAPARLQVSSIFDTAPESLTDADFHFWHRDFPTRNPREASGERAVPSIGAYLGELLPHPALPRGRAPPPLKSNRTDALQAALWPFGRCTCVAEPTWEH
ncbi:hypothetical protein BO221_05465 [Archangium sp. Cb G35]|uniref:hypothetical protein n=1 Tax=Archangium sp. Cb G35 TaxID=1920190 RepID=UPI000935F8B2|nr:hypothetical protein [Archangium sp. Cb G35]OJT27420.1 hypothetical protein BO221_05465 [Archangium sp. Cb G35]